LPGKISSKPKKRSRLVISLEEINRDFQSLSQVVGWFRNISGVRLQITEPLNLGAEITAVPNSLPMDAILIIHFGSLGTSGRKINAFSGMKMLDEPAHSSHQCRRACHPDVELLIDRMSFPIEREHSFKMLLETPAPFHELLRREG
jgi:hypothetical protein